MARKRKSDIEIGQKIGYYLRNYTKEIVGFFVAVVLFFTAFGIAYWSWSSLQALKLDRSPAVVVKQAAVEVVKEVPVEATIFEYPQKPDNCTEPCYLWETGEWGTWPYEFALAEGLGSQDKGRLCAQVLNIQHGDAFMISLEQRGILFGFYIRAEEYNDTGLGFDIGDVLCGRQNQWTRRKIS